MKYDWKLSKYETPKKDVPIIIGDQERPDFYVVGVYDGNHYRNMHKFEPIRELTHWAYIQKFESYYIPDEFAGVEDGQKFPRYVLDYGVITNALIVEITVGGLWVVNGAWTIPWAKLYDKKIQVSTYDDKLRIAWENRRIHTKEDFIKYGY